VRAVLFEDALTFFITTLGMLSLPATALLILETARKLKGES